MYLCMKLLKQQVNTETYVYITEKPFWMLVSEWVYSNGNILHKIVKKELGPYESRVISVIRVPLHVKQPI